jgi:hypothetical protein
MKGFFKKLVSSVLATTIVFSMVFSMNAFAVQTSSITIASLTNPSYIGQIVSFSVAVSSSLKNKTIDFFDGAIQIGSIHVGNTVNATFVTPANTFTKVGNHVITAKYDTVVSNSVTQVVKNDVDLALVSSNASSGINQFVTFTATLTSLAQPLNSSANGETVTFYNGSVSSGNVIGTGKILNGVATCETSFDSAFTSKTITASYPGDDSYIDTTGTTPQTVGYPSYSIKVDSDYNPSYPSQSVIVFATLSKNNSHSSSAHASAGLVVQFYDGDATTPFASETTDNSGVATIPARTYALGTHSITAKYFVGGSTTNYYKATTPLSQVVEKKALSIMLNSNSPSNYGDAVAFTTSKLPDDFSGKVTFSEGTTVLDTVSAASGIATYTTSLLSVGTHTITAQLNDDNFTGSATAQQVVNKKALSITLQSSKNPSVYGDAVKFTTSKLPDDFSGTVTFSEGATALNTVSAVSGIATYTTSLLSVGTHTITVKLNDKNYTGSKTLPQVVKVKLVSNGTLIADGTYTSTYGQPVTFTATGIPANTGVRFLIGGVAQSPATDSTVNGVQTITFTTSSTFAVGPHTVIAEYCDDGHWELTYDRHSGWTYDWHWDWGDPDHVFESDTLTHNVAKIGTSIKLASSSTSNTSSYGDPVTFTATVLTSGATGSVSFYDDGKLLKTIPVTGVTASYTASAANLLDVGNHPITAVLNATGNYSDSNTDSLTQSVIPADVTILLGSSSSTITYGTQVKFTATVNGVPGAAVPTGTVAFYSDNNTLLETEPLVDGVANYTTTDLLAAGSHPISAVYTSGDSHYNTRSSTDDENITQNVIKADVTILLESSSITSAYGTLVTFTATVQGVLNGTFPTGSVTFYDGPDVLETIQLDDKGVAVFKTVEPLTVGPHTISAEYTSTSDESKPLVSSFNFRRALFASVSIQSNYNSSTPGSTAGSITQSVVPADVTISLGSSSNPSAYGTQVKFTATVNGVPGAAVPTGTVKFYSDGNYLGIGTLNGGIPVYITTSLLAVGDHTISTVFTSGDSNYITRKSTTGENITQTVNKANLIITLSSSKNSSNFGDSVTFTALGLPADFSGVVKFYDGVRLLGSGMIVAGSDKSTFTTAGLASGSHSITAVLTDISYTGTSNVVVQVVNAPVTYTVHYLDGSGNKLADDKVGNGFNSQTITENAIGITGYTLSGDIAQTKKLSIDGNIITFVYTVNDETYTVNYVDKVTGKSIATLKTGKGIFNQAISEDAIDITGYVLSGDKTQKIKLSTDGNVITFKYTLVTTIAEEPSPTTAAPTSSTITISNTSTPTASPNSGDNGATIPIVATLLSLLSVVGIAMNRILKKKRDNV